NLEFTCQFDGALSRLTQRRDGHFVDKLESCRARGCMAMKGVLLGDTGVEVSAVCLGTMYFGSLIDEPVAFQILDSYAGAGRMLLDTANIYAGWIGGFAGGESEALLGRWLHARGNRGCLFVATKVGGILHRDHEPLPGSQLGLRAVQIETECE